MTTAASFVEAFNKGSFTLGNVEYKDKQPVEKKGNVLGFGGNATDIKAQEPALNVIKQLIEDRSQNKLLIPEEKPNSNPTDDKKVEGDGWLWTIVTTPLNALWSLACKVGSFVASFLNVISFGILFGEEKKEETNNNNPAPKQEAPKQEAPKQEAPKQEAPKQEAPKQEAPKPEEKTAVNQ